MELQYLTETRRHLHQHPELSMQEFETTAFIKRQLDDMKISYESPLPTGLIATIPGSSSTAVAFRADIDALPIHEENDCEFKSTVDDVMHACGHDGHTTMLLGFARRVKQLADNNELKTTVHFIFQPSEETMAGANQLINSYDFKSLDAIYGLHMMPDNDEGTILSKPGVLTASATEYRFFINGTSAHVANKEQGHSAGKAVTFLLNQLSQLQHYHLPGLGHNIIHIGKFSAGEAINTVPSSGYLEGTIRTFDMDDLTTVKNQMERIRSACEIVTGTSVRIEFAEGYPPTINDSDAYRTMHQAAETTDLEWIEKEDPYLFGEDFAFYSTIAPTAFAFLGCRNEEQSYVTGLHTSTFNFDESVLIKGINVFEAILNQYEDKI
ncbi:M20 metallopeptidase family protein [Macrococcus lamae]|uniref:Amidohydrolase n=1 Tax=Macrococcus lamae TaxID=198484 RepID=A0A4R6BXM1_9STAP|nr:M20 family metallopeptidase [Macrococcus lamae]TDM13279.1 amidohydrolase [Macrococcus lamae]